MKRATGTGLMVLTIVAGCSSRASLGNGGGDHEGAAGSAGSVEDRSTPAGGSGGSGASAGPSAGGASSAPGGTGGAAASGATGPAATGGSTSSGQGCAHREEPFTPMAAFQGYVENYQFPSGDDGIRLSFTSFDEGEIAGRAVLGAGSAGYPDVSAARGFGGADGRGPVEGFAYTMLDGLRTGARVRFELVTTEEWCEVCEQQIPYPHPQQGYACVPDTGVDRQGDVCVVRNPDTGQEERWDCGVIAVCLWAPVCECTAGGCTALGFSSGGRTGPRLSFDLTLEGDRLTGSVVELEGADGARYVRLTRDQSGP